MSVADKKLFNFDLVLHSGLFYECGSVWTYQFLASMSDKLDITRRVNSKMAGEELGQATNSDAYKCIPGRCAPARSFSFDDQKLFNFDLKLHSGLFYECGSPDSVWTYQCLASISGKLDIARTPSWLWTNLGKLQVAMRKHGCLGDVLRQDH